MKPVFACIVALAALPSWAAYKCVGSDGRTTFQELPCAASATQSAVRVAPPPPASSGTVERSASERSAINVAILQSYPLRGMTLKELQQAMGNPTRINTGDYDGGYTEQRIYERAGGTIYVYTDNGIVRSIQTTEAIRRPEPVRSARACASEFDIKNEEVSANSITLSDEQRRERQKKIAAMRACSD